MKVLLVYEGLVPVKYYGGTPRVIWHLGKELVDMGHDVTYLVHKGSTCSFGSVISIDEDKAIVDQIPDHIDIVHFQWTPPGLEKMTKPYVVTIHSNSYIGKPQDKNTIFVSKNHASRYGSTSYVTNGIDWSEYMPPDFSKKQDYFHFLGKAAWRVKNIQGAIDTIKKTKKERLKVLGGHRLNFKMGFRFTLSSRVSFHGMVGGKEKYQLLNNSKGLIFRSDGMNPWDWPLWKVCFMDARYLQHLMEPFLISSLKMLGFYRINHTNWPKQWKMQVNTHRSIVMNMPWKISTPALWLKNILKNMNES